MSGGSVSRRGIVFSENASSLFECLIVAGAPATGLLHDTLKCESSLQTTLKHLRDMWQRADTLYTPRADLESLHTMESASTVYRETQIPESIVVDNRKLSRYYIYLLFRYCMSSAWPVTHNRWIRMSHWEAKKPTAPLVDIPASWLETNMCNNYPSAPPMSHGNIPGPKNSKCLCQPQQLSQALERERHASERCNSKHVVQRTKASKGPDTARSAFHGGYNSTVDSEEEY